ncbi:MAG TPA: hypothetical protein VIV60_06735 [Polyangiaceae bacterium]
MENRDLYKQKHEAQMHEWSARLAVMKAQTEKLTAQAKLDIKGQLDAVQIKYDAATNKVKESWAATEEHWTNLVKEADVAWTELELAAKRVYHSVTTHEKH